MKYYSEVFNKLYTSEDELHRDELAKKRADEEAKKKAEEKKALEAKKNSERAAKAKEVQKTYDEACTAVKNAEAKLSEFCKEYGVYHTSIKSDDTFDWFDFMKYIFG